MKIPFLNSLTGRKPFMAPGISKAAVESNFAAETKGLDSEGAVKIKVTTEPARIAPRSMHIPGTLIAALCAKSHAKIVTDEELAAISQLQTEYERATEFLKKHLSTDARQAFKDQQAALTRSVLSGSKEAYASNTWTLADFEEDHMTKRRALKAQLRAISERTEPIVVSVAERIGKVARKFADDLEPQERETSKSWGVDFVPSRTLALLRYTAENAAQMAGHPGSNPPNRALVFAGIKIEATATQQ